MTIKRQDLIINVKEENGDTTMYFPITRVENVEGAVASINNIEPDSDGNITIPNATPSVSGLMSSSDKTKINSLSTGGGYKLPYATCSTAGDTKAKVATITNGISFSLEAGASCRIKTSNPFSGKYFSSKVSLTLNVNGTGAKPLYPYDSQTHWGYNDNSSSGSCDYYSASGTIDCVYNGSAWIVLSEKSHNAQQYGT